MTKSRVLALLASVGLLLGLFVVLPGLGADEKPGASRDGIYRPLNLFTEVLSLVRSNYVEKVELQPLLNGAFAGMTEAMDPFSEYVPPDQRAAFEAARTAEEKGKVVGAGLVLARRGGYPVVVATVPGGPAAAAGLRTDDILESVDGRPVRQMALWEVQAALAGVPATRVQVVAVRDAKPRRRTFEVTRVAWSPQAPSVTRSGGEAVLRIPSFDTGVARSVSGLLSPLDPNGTLVVDVRGAATGSLDEAARAAALFVGPGPLGELKGRKIEGRSWTAASTDQTYRGRVALLVDSGTAGPAELFAAALRDGTRREGGPAPDAAAKSGAAGTAPASPENGSASSSREAELSAQRARLRIRLVGEPTFGMGILQDVVPLASGGLLKLTVGKVWTASGKALSPKGVDPDDRVWSVSSDDVPSGGALETDPILQRGLKILGEKPAPSAS